MIVARRPRAKVLVPLVDKLWVHRGEWAHRYERVLPSGRMQLLVKLDDDLLCDYTLEGKAANRTRGAGFVGARTTPVLADTTLQRAICGVSFLPGGSAPFLNASASEYGEEIIELADLWGRSGAVLRERLLEAAEPDAQIDVLEAAMLERLGGRASRDRAIEVACALLSEGRTVHDVVHHLGVTPRRFIERFRARTGLTPKLFARIERFQHVLRAMDRRASFCELALEYGFADQAHLIREFRTFSGITPSAYRSRSLGEHNHVPLPIGKISSIRGHRADSDWPPWPLTTR
jgi:AraC-like DNA-binding protein